MLVLMLIGFLYFRPEPERPEKTISHHTILQKVEALGNLELVKYQFQEITELKKVSPEYFNLLKLGPDSKAVLIASGEAVGCLDLTKISPEDIAFKQDTLILKLPYPEICYHKLNLDKTRLYSLQTGYFMDENEFVQEAYQEAERQILRSARQSDILERVKLNAEAFLIPLLQEISQKEVRVYFGEFPKGDQELLLE